MVLTCTSWKPSPSSSRAYSPRLCECVDKVGTTREQHRALSIRFAPARCPHLAHTHSYTRPSLPPSARPPSRIGTRSFASTAGTPGGARELGQLRGQLEALRGQVEDLRETRARLEAERDQARAAVQGEARPIREQGPPWSRSAARGPRPRAPG
jgi:hypothetical protein